MTITTRLRLAGAAFGALALTLPAAVAQGQETAAAAADTAVDSARHHTDHDTTGQKAAHDTTGMDSTQWGYDTTREADVQNPPGYRGLERPVNVFPQDSAAADSAAVQATDRTGQMQRQDTMQSGEEQNPPGYRGMERPAGSDSARSMDDTDTTATPPSSRPDSVTRPDAAMTDSMAGGDSADVVHREREVPPGTGSPPPAYPADSAQAWVEENPGDDSVSVEFADEPSDTAR